MPKRTAVELCDLLDWRVKTLRHLNLFMRCDMGEPEAEDIRTCMGMIILEMEKILEQTDGGDRHAPDGEGPLGPLPPDVLDALGPGPAEAV